MTRNLRLRWLLVGLMFWIAFASSAFADGDRDRTQVGRNINIGPDEEVSEATCFGCSIRVRGHVSGDVTAFGGSIVVEDQGQIGGDLTTFGGNLRLGKDSQCRRGRDGIRRRIQRDPAATVGGDVTTMGGPGWMIVILLTPSHLSRTLCAADRMADSATAAAD